MPAAGVEAVSVVTPVRGSTGCVGLVELDPCRPDTVAVAGPDPDDIIVADDDGILCIPLLDGEGVAEDSARCGEKEASLRLRFEAGELSLDVSDVRCMLEELGVHYVDED